MKARLVECFSSLQGEGARVGERQVFVRFATCDRKCAYCDTPESIGGAPAELRVERRAGSGEFETRPNPIGGEELEGLLVELGSGALRPTVTLTGGEPLLQAGFLEEFLLPRRERFAFRLETHGLLPEAVGRVAPLVDEVVMDLKLPSATGESVDWSVHARFVETCRESGTTLTIKAVVAAGTTDEELEKVLELISGAGEGVTAVLQPVHPLPDGDGPPAPSLAQLLDWQARGLARGLDLRVVPQVHKLMEIL